jgi:radical SAM superfamily enzyme YgiQ (UPF0313 family)
MSDLRVALVWPKGFDAHYVIPIALGYLKSNVDAAKYDVRIIDCSLRGIDANSAEFRDELEAFAPHIVGVSTWSPTFKEALEVLRVAKSSIPGVTTLAGGAHPSSYPERVMEHEEVDFIFRGEADLSFPVFLDQFCRPLPDYGSVKGLTYRDPGGGGLILNDMERKDDLDVITMPDYDSIDLDGYIASGYRWNTPAKRNAPIWVTRGCPYRCTFCAAPDLNGRPIRTHSVEYMVDWVKYLYHEKGIRWFNIIDDNFTFNWRYAMEFCRAIIALDLPGIGFGTPNGIRLQKGSPELWLLMKRAGWRSLNVAPESGSQKVLNIMKKDLDIEIVPKVVNDIRAAGLKVQAYFIIGYPGEAPVDLEETSDLIKRCRFNFVFLNNFQPLPGTPVYDDLVAKGEIEDGLLPQNYSDGSRAYTPKEFEGFNFPRFILKTYLLMVLRDPFNLPYMIRIFSPGMIAVKVFRNFVGMFAGQPEAQHFDRLAEAPMAGTSHTGT